MSSSHPSEYTFVLESYASHGFRIIALASKVIVPAIVKAGEINLRTREQVKYELTFLVFILLD